MENLTVLLKAKYLEAKEIVRKLEDGTWKDDPEISKMSLTEIEAVREVKKQFEDMGIHLTSGTEEKN